MSYASQEVGSEDRVMILAPIVRGRKGEFKQEMEKLVQHGFTRARIDGELLSLEDEGAGGSIGAEVGGYTTTCLNLQSQRVGAGVNCSYQQVDGRTILWGRRAVGGDRHARLEAGDIGEWHRERRASVVRAGANVEVDSTRRRRIHRERTDDGAVRS